MRNRNLEPDHPDISVSFGNLAYCCFKRNELSQSLYFTVQALARETLYILHRYPLLPSSLRLKALRRSVNSQNQLYEIACIDSSAISPAYWARINRHGILQSLEKDQMQCIRSLASGKSYAEELALIYRELEKSNLNQNRRMHLLRRQEYFEKTMYKDAAPTNYAFVSIKELHDVIPPEAVLLEFICINYADQYQYRVFCLAQTYEPLSFDFVSDAATLDTLVAKALFSLSNGLGDSKLLLSELSQLLFVPLASRLKEVSQIYITLDSSLHQIPLLALPHWQDSERLICDDYRLTILTSSRDLLTRHADANTQNCPVVVAATEYQETDLKDQGTTRKAGRTVLPCLDSATKSYEDLPFAKLEGRAVASILNAELILESQATLDYLRSLESPRILHLAAHGIYNGADPSKHYSDEGCEFRIKNALATRDSMEFMRCSGIILAYEADQGQSSFSFLSALDIVHLNLNGTELVVLSACDTGLVNVAAGEGVYGLERAIIVAGAQAMLLSLWAVQDDATCAFMVRYYTLLKGGAGRFDALVKVQQEFRVHRNIIWRDPYYWAAWQLIGDGGPIEGL
jgi:CHAT domain-containing protein